MVALRGPLRGTTRICGGHIKGHIEATGERPGDGPAGAAGGTGLALHQHPPQKPIGRPRAAYWVAEMGHITRWSERAGNRESSGQQIPEAPNDAVP